MLGHVSSKKQVIPTLPPDRCFAKTVTTENGRSLDSTVFHHCLLVGVVAETIAEGLPAWYQESLIPSHVGLFSSLHDIGKAYPAFQCKLRRNCNVDLEGLQFQGDQEDKLCGYHYSVTYAHFKSRDKNLAFALGRHHGRIVCGKVSLVLDPSDWPIFGGPAWKQVREDIVRQLERAFDCSVADIVIPNLEVASGILTLADWIASDERFNFEQSDNKEVLTEHARKVVSTLGLQLPPLHGNLSFRTLFGFDPRKFQEVFFRQIEPGGIYVLEAPMGGGKTEAALYATYRILLEKKATGIYFALPTRVTSNAIFNRLKTFAERIVEDKEVLVTLVHGVDQAVLEQEDVAPGGTWFQSQKKAILAPLGAGTIDQALMSVIKVRHNYERAFALAGKVVVLDEVHSYDTYTSVLIEKLVQLLQQLRCTVVLLSATLTRQLKQRLLGVASLPASSSYPVMTSVSDGVVKSIPLPAQEKSSTEIIHVAEDTAAFEQCLEAAYAGQQVLWIENTISEAQQVFRVLYSRRDGLEVGLLHSAFTPKDRGTIETKWIGLYGGKSNSKRKERGRILVGTQVLEQSLDIDADLLFTRMCPVDLLLQRAGRLWRHRENDGIRPAGAARKMVVLPSVLESSGSFVFKGKTQYVYAKYVLCRSLLSLLNRTSLNLPDDIPTLVEKVYEPRQESGVLLEYKEEMEMKKRELERKALASEDTQMDSSWDDDENCTTRYDEKPSGSLLIVRQMSFKDGLLNLQLLDDTSLVLSGEETGKQRKKIGISLLENSVTLDRGDIPQDLGGLKDVFSRYVYIGDASSGTISFGVGLLGKDGSVRAYSSQNLIGWYSHRIGYERGENKEKRYGA